MAAEIGNLLLNKLISKALHGYLPFQPDLGMMCGGFQGPLYPNPTTLLAPGFDSLQFRDQAVSSYTMTTSYDGLGAGNPGVDYTNPGHIVGLLDTFARMSYGIAILSAIYNGQDATSDLAPVANIAIPMESLDGTASSFGISDIYPAFSELPPKWMDSLSIDDDTGEITPDPRERPQANFSSSVFHFPVTSQITPDILAILFDKKSIFSYLGMPQYFRSIIQILFQQANALSQKTEIDFTLQEPELFDEYSTFVQFFPKNPDPPGFHTLNRQKGTFYAQNVVITPLQALNILTGSSAYHDGINGQNEYRSLPELNSVINITPLQMVGATYWYENVNPTFPGGTFTELNPREFYVSSYMIADFVINISDDLSVNQNAGTVRIQGEARMHSLITDPTAFNVFERFRKAPADGDFSNPGELVEYEASAFQKITKEINIALDLSNSFSWDKSWLNQPSNTDSEALNALVDLEAEFTGYEPGIGLNTLDQSDLVIPIDKTFTLTPGCTSIRMRCFARNLHSLLLPVDRFFLFDGFWAKPHLWVPEEICHEHGFLLFPPTFHCHWPVGTIENRFVDILKKESIVEDLAVPNIELSFTLTGDKIQSTTYEVSV